MTPSQILTTAHISMATSFIVALATLYIIYGSHLNLSIPILIFLHISFVIIAAIFKISYVARLTALKQLGRPVH